METEIMNGGISAIAQSPTPESTTPTKKEKKKKKAKKVKLNSGVQIRSHTSEGEGSSKLSSKRYEKELARLQVELVKMQYWVKHTGTRIVILFEGRDAAGKGGHD
jgi:polyphosphate kinase